MHYPAGAAGDAEVVLELVVGADGRVESAHAISGDEPFVSAALDAARAWTFTPAHRGDVAVRARVRMAVAFHAPPPPPPPAPDTTAPEAASAPSPPGPSPARGPLRAAAPGGATGAPAAVEEVNIRGARASRDAPHALGAAEVRQLPGAFGDPFRAIEVLPGVTPIASGIPYFFLRGAPPGNTGYFLDGIRVPALFHLGLGPSVVHPALIEKVDLYGGPYPARFGRQAGGIVSADVKEPASIAHGEANVRLFDAGALVEAPMGDGRATALAAGRYAYAGLLLPLFAPNTRLSYADYQGRATYEVGDSDRLGVFLFGTSDELSQRDAEDRPFQEQLGFSFHRVDLRDDHYLRGGGRLRTALTLGADQSTQEDLRSVGWVAGLRSQLDTPVASNARLHLGSDVQIDRALVRSASPATEDIYPKRTDVDWGVYAEIVWRAAKRIEITPGVRFDMYGANYDSAQATDIVPAVDPRFETRVFVTPAVTWVSAFGLAHQAPSTFVPLPGLELGRLSDGLQSSWQTSEGAEVALPEAITVGATVFLSTTTGLSDAAATCTELALDVDNGCSAQHVAGRAYGLELSAKRAITKRISGIFSYTLSRARREIHPANDPSATIDVASELDRTHVFNAALAVDMGVGWYAGARWVAYTGRPYTRLYQLNGRNVFVPPYNELRLDGFDRLDLRLEKRFPLGARGHVSIVAEMLNTFLSKEAVGIDCNWDAPPPGHTFPDFTKPNTPGNGCVQSQVGPISVPSLGLEGAL